MLKDLKITKYEISIDKVMNIWENIDNNNNGRTFHIYVDNPFCLQECSYCIYRPIETKIGSDIYNDYYTHILPNEIARFKHIMEKYPFESVYFGGGTASYMTKEIMVDIFERIPKFKEIPYKMFEAHPIFLNKEKIDILSEYGFTYISLGVQSFNKELLKKYNRLYTSPEKINELVKYIQSKDIEVNTDLLAFLKLDDEPDIYNTMADLKTIARTINPNNITIYPMYQTWDDHNVTETTELVKTLRKELAKFLVVNTEWKVIADVLLSLNEKIIMEAENVNYVIYRGEYLETSRYNSSGLNVPDNQITLALGGSSMKPIYSYIGKEIKYNTIWDNVNKRNKYIKVELGGEQ